MTFNTRTVNGMGIRVLTKRFNSHRCDPNVKGTCEHVVIVSCVLLLTLQRCFSGTGTSYTCPSTSEVIVRYMLELVDTKLQHIYKGRLRRQLVTRSCRSQYVSCKSNRVIQHVWVKAWTVSMFNAPTVLNVNALPWQMVSCMTNKRPVVRTPSAMS